jgi:GAF domain-containing protein
MTKQPSVPAEARPTTSDPATTFSMVAEIVYRGGDFEDIYSSICEAAVLLIPGCDHASFMLDRNGSYTTVAATDEIADRIDAAERALGEGPCMDALLEEAGQVDVDLAVNPSWPALAEYILENTPVRCVAGFRLVIDDRKAGALNLFSDTPGGFTQTAIDQAAVLAAFASVAMAAVSNRETADSLRAGLASNREIGKAVGLMMAFHKVSDEEAFEILKKASQDMNVKLADVAREVVDHHNRR